MNVASYQLIRFDGVRIPPIKAMPSTREAQVRAALSVMISEARTAFAHRLLFVMDDGTRVIAKPRTPA